MVWSCIGAFGVGQIGQIVGNMNSEIYCDILNTHLLGTLAEHHLQPHEITFQQDNDPKHNSLFTRTWLQQHHLVFPDWPANSPDLNPIKTCGRC